MANDAKFVNVLQSTAGGGKHSRIVAHPSFERANGLAPQTPTVPRYYSDYVVTEFGVARIKGKSNTERTKALISIAHPDFRDPLRRQAKELGLM
jgi:acyl-CoA hydrolase